MPGAVWWRGGRAPLLSINLMPAARTDAFAAFLAVRGARGGEVSITAALRPLPDSDLHVCLL